MSKTLQRHRRKLSKKDRSTDSRYIRGQTKVGSASTVKHDILSPLYKRSLGGVVSPSRFGLSYWCGILARFGLKFGWLMWKLAKFVLKFDIMIQYHRKQTNKKQTKKQTNEQANKRDRKHQPLRLTTLLTNSNIMVAIMLCMSPAKYKR